VIPAPLALSLLAKHAAVLLLDVSCVLALLWQGGVVHDQHGILAAYETSAILCSTAPKGQWTTGGWAVDKLTLCLGERSGSTDTFLSGYRKAYDWDDTMRCRAINGRASRDYLLDLNKRTVGAIG
jgi:hypothetical protein